MSLTDEQRDEFLEYLRGTPRTFADALNSSGFTEDELTASDYDYIDDQIFECQVCGWWCDTGQMAEACGEEGTTCIDCYEEAKEAA